MKDGQPGGKLASAATSLPDSKTVLTTTQSGDDLPAEALGFNRFTS